MEQPSSLFSLSIDPVTKAHLSETAKWARFLAIMGFILVLLFLGVGVYASIILSRFDSAFSGSSRYRGMGYGFGAGMLVGYVIAALVAFFPLLFMLRFANKMRRALNTDDQALLNSSFQNLKIYFRYIGIIAVISIVIMALSFFMGVAFSTIN